MVFQKTLESGHDSPPRQGGGDTAVSLAEREFRSSSTFGNLIMKTKHLC